MKLRTGFVSNSSSSSFLLVGKVVGNAFTDSVKMERGKRYWMVGRWLNDGQDVFPVDARMLKWLRHLDEEVRDRMDISGDVIEEVTCGEDDCVELPATLPEGAKAWAFDRDYHCTEGLQELKDNYAC